MKINRICYWTNFHTEGKHKFTLSHTVMLVKAESLQGGKRDVFLFLYSTSVFITPRQHYGSKLNAQT